MTKVFSILFIYSTLCSEIPVLFMVTSEYQRLNEHHQQP